MAALSHQQSPAPPSSSPSPPATPTLPDFLNNVLFRVAASGSPGASSASSAPSGGSGGSGGSGDQLYQLRVTGRAAGAGASASAAPLLRFAVHAFSADDADDADAGGAPACAGEVTTSSMQIGSRALTTVLLSGDLRAVGLGREARGTLDMAAETISWSRGAAGGANVTWIVHARAIETNQLESLVGTEVSDLDRLSSAQLKVAMLFSAFDKDGDTLQQKGFSYQ